MKNDNFKVLNALYNGCVFRSLLEARWALFLDELEIRWWYEPQAFQLPNGSHYRPDFFFPQVNMRAEVKATELTSGELYKCRAVAAGTGAQILMLVGPPDFQPYKACLPCVIGEGPQTYREAGVEEFLLDVDYHKRLYFHNEHRLFGVSPGDFKEEDFTPRYRAAVYASRAARFDTWLEGSR